MDNTEPTFEQLISQLQVHESEDQLVVGLDFGTTVRACDPDMLQSDADGDLV